ncbi:MAG TPA: hypothetical protein VFB63_15845 [Bryobacteraceae bacterium]|jgi:hypothetical protein|nr:hypothetical protein [Bryobacteraceae bacterium]
MLVHNARGHYSFIRGIAPYSGGAVADDGFEVVHARFHQPVPLKQGFQAVEQHLAAAKLPIHSLCGMELRSPRPFTFQGFNDFNAGYIDVLKHWGLFLEGVNPVARTNIAPKIVAPREPSLYGFSYTSPSAAKQRTFIVAGAGELPEGSLDPHDVVRRGETSADALREKARFVMGLMSGRLQGLVVGWNDVTVAEVYTLHPMWHLLESELIRPMGKAAIHGLTWHYSAPPIETIEFEMDLRGCQRELVL